MDCSHGICTHSWIAPSTRAFSPVTRAPGPDRQAQPAVRLCRTGSGVSQGEDFGRTVIGTVELAAQMHPGGLEICTGSRRQRQQFRRHQPLRRAPAYGQANASVHALVIATIAAARPVTSAIDCEAHLRCHHAALDVGRACAEPQQKRQDQNPRPMPRPAFHGVSRMAPPSFHSKSCLSQKPAHSTSTESSTLSVMLPAWSLKSPSAALASAWK